MNDICFGCKHKEAVIADLVKKNALLSNDIELLKKSILQEQITKARAVSISHDLAQRLRIRIGSDDLRAWPGDRSALLDSEKLNQEVYQQDIINGTKA